MCYTGGTMGMKSARDGMLRCVPGYLTERVEKEILSQDGMPECDIFEYDELIDSSLMTPKVWKQIAIDVARNYGDYDGFVIIHGTDTMSYTASALSFMLQNLSKPVILTGSNIPMCNAINDAARNLTASILYAATLDIPEVCVFFNDMLLRGNRTVKVDNGGLRAFESPNYPPLATLKVHTSLHSEYVLRFPRSKFRLRTAMEPNILALKLVPGFQDDAIEAIVKSGNLRGLVLEVYGSGTGLAGKDKQKLRETLEDAVDRDIVVVAGTQCLKGTIDLGAYEAGIDSTSTRIVSGCDMTTEAIVTKLSYLLGIGLSVDRVREMMETPLCGELTALTEYKRVGLNTNQSVGNYRSHQFPSTLAPR